MFSWTVRAKGKFPTCRVGNWRGSGRRMGVAVSGGFRNAGASLPAMAPFPVAALRTQRAAFPHWALQWDHAFRTRNTLATAGRRRPGSVPRYRLRKRHGFRLATCGAVRCAAEPVDASTTPHLLSAVPSLGHVMLPGFPVIVRGNRQSHSRDLSPFGHRSSPEAPSLRQHYPASLGHTGLSATLPAQPFPRGLSVGACHATGQGFPCCVHSPLPCVLPPIPRRNLSVHVSLASRLVTAFPVIRAGRLPHYAFRGLLGVYSRYGPHGR